MKQVVPEDVARHRRAAESVLNRVTASGREELTLEEQREFDQHRMKMSMAIDAHRLHGGDTPAPPRHQVADDRTLADLRQDLQRASDKVEGRRKPSRVDSRPACCFHEAGHAVAFLARGTRLEEVWVAPPSAFTSGGSVAGEVLGQCRTEGSPLDPVALTAGAAASARAGLWCGGMSDADLLLRTHALERRGMTDASLPGVRAAASQLVADHWPAIVAVAGALDRHGRLSGDEVASIAFRAMRRAEEPVRGLAYCVTVGLPAWV